MSRVAVLDSGILAIACLITFMLARDVLTRVYHLSQAWCHAAQLKLIMTVGPLPDALEPGFHGARTHWIRGLMSFRLTRRRDEADS